MRSEKICESRSKLTSRERRADPKIGSTWDIKLRLMFNFLSPVSDNSSRGIASSMFPSRFNSVILTNSLKSDGRRVRHLRVKIPSDLKGIPAYNSEFCRISDIFHLAVWEPKIKLSEITFRFLGL